MGVGEAHCGIGSSLISDVRHLTSVSIFSIDVKSPAAISVLQERVRSHDLVMMMGFACTS